VWKNPNSTLVSSTGLRLLGLSSHSSSGFVVHIATYLPRALFCSGATVPGSPLSSSLPHPYFLLLDRLYFLHEAVNQTKTNKRKHLSDSVLISAPSSLSFPNKRVWSPVYLLIIPVALSNHPNHNPWHNPIIPRKIGRKQVQQENKIEMKMK
jgi:hypothetical protein